MPRNLEMLERIECAPVRSPFSFVVAGDSGAWPDPTADAIFSRLVAQITALEPPPLFFANLGDFAGPGTQERHEDYLRLVEPLTIPNICVVGNHDLDDPRGPEVFANVHGSFNYTFAYGNTRFVVIDDAPGEVGETVVDPSTAGPREAELEFLDRTLTAAGEPVRVILMHMPPHLDGHYAPHAEWGFEQREDEFLQIVREHGIQLVCCAHGLAYDRHVRDGTVFVMSGGGGTGGALYHAVELTISGTGDVSTRLIRAFG